MQTHYRACTLCEATCGVTLGVEGNRVVSVRGDEEDPLSRGYICPKGTALADLHHDPDRLRRPLIRDGADWRETGWEEALELVARRLRELRRAHGNDSIAGYQGNPTAHNLGLMTHGQLLFRTLGTRNLFSTCSLDTLPQLLAAYSMFGSQLLMPVPDIDRCELFVCLGANPLVTHGLGAANVRERLASIRTRGGRVIVLDPRRNETAERADEHHFLRPGSDAALLLGIIHTLFAERRVKTTVPVRHLDELEQAARPWTAERAASVTGIDPQQIQALARALSDTERAVLYGRIGVCTQEFGGLASWLVYAVNALTHHLDRPGGLMFTTPAIDPVALTTRLGQRGSFARYKSRVGGLPEFNGELPVAALIDEIETPGPGQVRALITSACNPVLAMPGGARLENALSRLEFMVSIDPYLNETTRHAHVILPPASPLERSHYSLAVAALQTRNGARYSPPVFERPEDALDDWEICTALFARLTTPVGASLLEWALRKLTPDRLVDLGLRFSGRGLSLAKVKNETHVIDLGPLEPRLPDRLATTDKHVDLAPSHYLQDLERLARFQPGGALVLIGRRQLRSNNSWMHNSERLVKGPVRCTLLIHPDDARARGLSDGTMARVATKVGSVELPVELCADIMPGVVSIPHGWGHHRSGTRLSVASRRPGVSVNDIIDPSRVDALTGTSALSGQPVEVSAA